MLIALQFLISSSGGYDEISTSQMSEYITSGEVKEITFVDGDQVIKATLDDSVDRDGGRKVTTKCLTGTQGEHLGPRSKQAISDGQHREGQRRGARSPSLLGSFICHASCRSRCSSCCSSC